MKGKNLMLFYDKLYRHKEKQNKVGSLDNRVVGLVHHRKVLDILLKKNIIRYLKNKKELKLLDVGCGGENTTISLVQKTFPRIEIYGIDISREAGRMFYNNTNTNTFKLGSVTNIPFDDNFFDIVLCVSVLHHVENDILGLSEICRVLKTGGMFILNEPTFTNFKTCKLPFNNWGHLPNPTIFDFLTHPKLNERPMQVALKDGPGWGGDLRGYSKTNLMTKINSIGNFKIESAQYIMKYFSYLSIRIHHLLESILKFLEKRSVKISRVRDKPTLMGKVKEPSKLRKIVILLLNLISSTDNMIPFMTGCHLFIVSIKKKL